MPGCRVEERRPGEPPRRPAAPLKAAEAPPGGQAQSGRRGFRTPPHRVGQGGPVNLVPFVPASWFWGSRNWKIKPGIESRRECKPSLLIPLGFQLHPVSTFQFQVSSFRLRIPILAEETNAPLENRRGLRINGAL